MIEVKKVAEEQEIWDKEEKTTRSEKDEISSLKILQVYSYF